MSARLYWSPMVTGGAVPGWRASISELVRSAGSSTRPFSGSSPRYTADGDDSASAGQPTVGFALVAVITNDWTAVDADATQIQLVPDVAAGTFRALLDAITARTVGDLPLVYRTRWTDVLTTLGAPTADVTLATPLRRVLRRAMYAIDRASAHDDALLA